MDAKPYSATDLVAKRVIVEIAGNEAVTPNVRFATDSDARWLATLDAVTRERDEAVKQRDALADECSKSEHIAREAGADESIRSFPVALRALLTRLTDERDAAVARAKRAEADRDAAKRRAKQRVNEAEKKAGTK